MAPFGSNDRDATGYRTLRGLDKLTDNSLVTVRASNFPIGGDNEDCTRELDVVVISKRPAEANCNQFVATASTDNVIIGTPITLTVSPPTAEKIIWSNVNPSDINKIIANAIPNQSKNTYTVNGSIFFGEWEEPCTTSVNVNILPIIPIVCENTDFKLTTITPIVGEGFSESSVIVIEGCPNPFVWTLDGFASNTTTTSSSATVTPTKETTYNATCYNGKETKTASITIKYSPKFIITASPTKVSYVNPKATLTVSGCSPDAPFYGSFSWKLPLNGNKRTQIVTLSDRSQDYTQTYTATCNINGQTINVNVDIQYTAPIDCNDMPEFKLGDENRGLGVAWILKATGCNYRGNSGLINIYPEKGSNSSDFSSYYGLDNGQGFGISINKNKSIKYYATCSFDRCYWATSVTLIGKDVDNKEIPYVVPALPIKDKNKLTENCLNLAKKFSIYLAPDETTTAKVQGAKDDITYGYLYDQAQRPTKFYLFDEGCADKAGEIKWWNTKDRDIDGMGGGGIGEKDPLKPDRIIFNLPPLNMNTFFYGRCYYKKDNINYYCDVDVSVNAASSYRIATDSPTQEEIPITNSITGITAPTGVCADVPAQAKMADFIQTLLGELLKGMNCSRLSLEDATALIQALQSSFANDGILQNYTLTNTGGAIQALISSGDCTIGAKNAATLLASSITGNVNGSSYGAILEKLAPLIKKINNQQVVTKPDASTNSNECTRTDWNTKLFISPSGQPIKLPSGWKPTTFRFDQIGMPFPTNGVLQGFIDDNGNSYWAVISGFGAPFQGYALVGSHPRSYIKPETIYQAVEEKDRGVKKDKVVLCLFNSTTTGNDINCSYSYKEFEEYNFNPLYPDGSLLSAGDLPINQAGTVLCTFSIDCPEAVDPDIYAKKIQAELIKYNLVNTKIILDGYSKPYKITTNGLIDATTKANNITITRNSELALSVRGSFDGSKCSDCAVKASNVLNESIAQYKADLGNIYQWSTVVKGTTILNDVGKQGGGIVYQPMSLYEVLAAMVKGYNSMVDNAKVPEEVWVQPNSTNFPVKDKTGIISGGLDGVAEGLKGTAQLGGQLVEVGLTVITNPKKTASDLATFVKSSNFDWEHTKELTKTLAIGVGQGVIGYDPDEFNKGGEYALHASGKVVGTVVFEAATGGALAALIKKSGSTFDDILSELMQTLTKSWSAVDKAKFIQVFTYSTKDAQQKAMAILAEFKSGNLSAEASKILWEWGNLSNKLNIQANLTIPANKLAGIDINGTPVTIETIADVFNNKSQIDNAQGLIQQMSNALDANDIDGFKAALKGKITFTKTAILGLASTLIPPSNVTQTLLDTRKAAQQTLQDLKSTGNALKETVKDETKKIINASEKMAEDISDWRFRDTQGLKEIDLTYGNGKAGFFDRLYKDTNGNWTVVECKGGASPLKGRRALDGTYNQQGTKEYIDSIIKNLRANQNQLSDSQKALLSELETAYGSSKIKSYVLNQKFTNTGELGETILTAIDN